MSKPTVDHIERLSARTDQIPDAPEEMWAAWRRIVLDRAPDLAAMLGVAS